MFNIDAEREDFGKIDWLFNEFYNEKTVEEWSMSIKKKNKWYSNKSQEYRVNTLFDSMEEAKENYIEYINMKYEMNLHREESRNKYNKNLIYYDNNNTEIINPNKIENWKCTCKNKINDALKVECEECKMKRPLGLNNNVADMIIRKARMKSGNKHKIIISNDGRTEEWLCENCKRYFDRSDGWSRHECYNDEEYNDKYENNVFRYECGSEEELQTYNSDGFIEYSEMTIEEIDNEMDRIKNPKDNAKRNRLAWELHLRDKGDVAAFKEAKDESNKLTDSAWLNSICD